MLHRRDAGPHAGRVDTAGLGQVRRMYLVDALLTLTVCCLALHISCGLNLDKIEGLYSDITRNTSCTY